ncbi:PREDICTED: uncharacterized protein LOC108620963 [Drosophila arizonae]|uniref:Uncharacterized protein LOC108620963 n=1 Tax=Drosophila arizonae TaxID=7263 RepID=A0ABM1Q222_DROAR|nr:PREDICTED: uncharacterized protein LOC108620963 [Drosophila arizonae]
MKEEIVHLTKSTYEIFRDEHNDNNLWSSFKELLRKLDSVPTNLHGWWRLPAFFSTFSSKEAAREFFRTRYDVNIDLIEECKDLNELQQHLIDKLKCQSADEISFVKQRSLQHFLIKNVHHWSQLGEFNLNPIDILETGSFDTLSHMASLLEKHDQKLPDESLIDFFLEQLNKYNRRLLNPGRILSYISKYQEPSKTVILVQKLISNSRSGWDLGNILYNTDYVLQSTLINGLLFFEHPTGVKRIESAYLNSLSTWNTVEHIKQSNFITYVSKMKTGQIELFDEMLDIISNISQREIAQNSKDHRVQIRFIRAILNLERFGETIPAYWNDKLWIALLNPRNLMNIKLLYECLVAKLVPRFEMLQEQLMMLGTLQPDQQESVISVAHIYCICKWNTLKTEQLQSVFELLWLHVASVNFRTMLFSQLVLRRLADKCEKSSMEVPLVSGTKANLALLIDDKNLDFQTDARLLLPKIIENFNVADAILYITNAPFDEFENPKWLFSQYEMEDLDKLRSAFKSKSLEI